MNEEESAIREGGMCDVLGGNVRCVRRDCAMFEGGKCVMCEGGKCMSV